MVRVFIALLLLASGAFGAVTKLYLKDGTYHLVREWKREGDRVKFYSTERSDWEEVPVDLVDLRKTEAEMEDRKEALKDEAKIVSDEDKAIRAQRNEILKIPQDPGVYTLDDQQQLRIFPQADTKIHTSKGRTALKIATGLGMLMGKGTVELDQPHSVTIVTNDRQEFYFQLAQDETFGIVKLTPHHNVRIVEKLTIAPKGIDQTAEELVEVPSFKKQLSEGGLYKVWPEKPLEPGEYAVVEFTQGKVDPRVWDFQIKK
jgi:hypothetical protein